MPLCECGFNFAKGKLGGEVRESYAVIREVDYRRVIRKEIRLVAEKDKSKRLKMIGDAAQWVGVLMVCPRCGTFTLIKPGADAELIRLKAVK